MYKLPFFMFFIFIFSNAFAGTNLIIGKYKSRAILNIPENVICPAPLIVMIPGSGANGPEEMMPASMTANGKDHSIFGSFSNSLNKSGIITLALGKPGIDFFSGWDQDKWFYDKQLYLNLGWQDLINNLKEAVTYTKNLPCVDSNRIFVLGHSEGTQVAPDFVNQNPDLVKGLILIGFSGENLATTVDWQLFKRPIDSWLSPDVDVNHDRRISKEEASNWPEFVWNWNSESDSVSFDTIENALRSNPSLIEDFEGLSEKNIWKGVIKRNPVYPEISNLKQDIYVFTGALDTQTRPEESIKLMEFCKQAHKNNCFVNIVEGLGHGMSKPLEPRKQKFLDSTLGPVDSSFSIILEELGRSLKL